MLDKNSVDMVYVDVARTTSNANVTTIVYFDTKQGKSSRETITGGTFENLGYRLATALVSFAPVRVIFDIAGLGIAMRDSTLNALSRNLNVEIDKTGWVKVKPGYEICMCDCGCGTIYHKMR